MFLLKKEKSQMRCIVTSSCSLYRRLVPVAGLLCLSVCHAASLAVSVTQGPSPSPTTPSTAVSVTTAVTFTADAGEQTEALLNGTVQYRWKWLYDGEGSVTGATPAGGQDTWSDWGPYDEATATGTFNQAGPLILSILAEARVVDGNGTVTIAAVAGQVNASVSSAGLYAVEAYDSGLWRAVGDMFLGLPATSYPLRAIRWPYGSAWPSGMPSWTVAGSVTGSGPDLAVSAPAVIGQTKAISVTDGTVTVPFTLKAASAYAGFDTIQAKPYGCVEWQAEYTYSYLFDWEGTPQYQFRILKDDTALPWYTGHPQWSTSITEQTWSGDTISISHEAGFHPERETLECRWGPGADEYVRFFISYVDGDADYIIECVPCIPKGGIAYPGTGYMQYKASWGASPLDTVVDLREPLDPTQDLVQGPPHNWHPMIAIRGMEVGEARLTIAWPYDEYYTPCPRTTSASRMVRVLDLLSLQANCGSPINESKAWPPSDSGSEENIATKYVPAVAGTPIRLTSIWQGGELGDYVYLRQAIDYTWGTTEERLYDRPLLESMCGRATIVDPGTYTCRAGVDYYGVGNASFDSSQETLAAVVFEAVGVSSLSVTCQHGGSTLLNQSFSTEKSDLFLKWPDKTGASVSITATVAATATHDQWPASYPAWTGCDSSSGTAGTANGLATSTNVATITAAGTTTLVADCGTSRTARLHAILLDVDASGVDEADETTTGLEVDKNSVVRIPLTVTRSPASLAAGKVRITCSGTSSAFTLWKDATTRFPTTSFPQSSNSVDIQLSSTTTMGDALPGTIYIEPNGSSFSTTLSIIYLNASGTELDRDSILIHTGD
jgi:hypothetical protein